MGWMRWEDDVSDPTFEELLKLVMKLPPPTDEEREEQIISFAYGNLRLSGIDVTKEQLRAIMDKRKGNP